MRGCFNHVWLTSRGLGWHFKPPYILGCNTEHSRTGNHSGNRPFQYRKSRAIGFWRGNRKCTSFFQIKNILNTRVHGSLSAIKYWKYQKHMCRTLNGFTYTYFRDMQLTSVLEKITNYILTMVVHSQCVSSHCL